MKSRQLLTAGRRLGSLYENTSIAIHARSRQESLSLFSLDLRDGTIRSRHLKEPLQATPEVISEVIAALPHNPEGSRFAILSDQSQTYMQALYMPEGFQLEYQEGTIAEHYHCIREDLSAEEVIGIFNDYLARDILWKRRSQFECRDLRTSSFRAGFWMGQLFRRIVDVFGARRSD